MKQRLDEKIFVEINGARQGMFLQSEDIENPVLLFLHGGPGSPEIAFAAENPTGLEKMFTVCWWEQRGSGISYHGGISKETMTMEQMIADTVSVARYLCKRFRKEKLYVMGHSWGSVLGVLTVQRAPELFSAYIGVGQVARQDESERLAYTYMLEQFRAAGNRRMVRKLEKFPIDQGGEISKQYLFVRSDGMMKLGIGIMHRSRSILDPVKTVLRFKGYTLREKMQFPLGDKLSLSCLWDSVMQSDFFKQIPRLEVPLYIFQGKYDYQVSYVVAKRFARAVDAPLKGFYTFEYSAHSPCFEEPEKMCRILREDVLRGKAALADSLEI